MNGADAVVVGAGIIGCAVALELGRAGRRVVVVERAGGAGFGSTSASSAIIRFGYSTDAGVALAWESRAFWEGWRDYLAAPASEPVAQFRPVGMLSLGADAEDSAAQARLAAAGVPCAVLSPGDIAARHPWMDIGRYGPPVPVDDPSFFADATGELAGLWTPDAGYVNDPHLAAGNLAAAARRSGVVFRHGASFDVLLLEHGRVAGVRLADGTNLAASVVVNAAGPWSALVNAAAGIGHDFTIGTRPLRQEVHLLPPPGAVPLAGPGVPVILDADLGVYLRPATEGLLVGGLEPRCDPLEWLRTPDDPDPRATGPVFHRQALRAARRIPSLAIPNTPRGVAGVYDVADDWTPIYDRTAVDGYYVAMGTSGNQFKNAPVVGQAMSRLIGLVEAGHDHDRSPVQHIGERTGLTIDLGTFARGRRPHDTAGSVLG